jgi:5-methylcytosine-specific restriction endonuclease McrA
MCRGTNVCTELGSDPSLWGSESPLRPREWFPEAFLAFQEAREVAEQGDIVSALSYLERTRERELNEWFDVHAQNSGRFRAMHFGPEPKPEVIVKDPVKTFAGIERQLMERDGYTCQYCGIPVLHSSALTKFRDQVGAENFPTVGTNAHRHGVKLVFSGTLDHVEPHSRGGRTSPENLVTCCWPCNYGKAEYTLAELGIKDPRVEPSSA